MQSAGCLSLPVILVSSCVTDNNHENSRCRCKRRSHTRLEVFKKCQLEGYRKSDMKISLLEFVPIATHFVSPSNSFFNFVLDLAWTCLCI